MDQEVKSIDVTIVVRFIHLNQKGMDVQPKHLLAIRIYLEGNSYRAIARILNVNPQSVVKWVNQYNAKLPAAVLTTSFISHVFGILNRKFVRRLLLSVKGGLGMFFRKTIGDIDQLPSVGAGDVLRNLIHSDIAPITRLNTCAGYLLHPPMFL